MKEFLKKIGEHTFIFGIGNIIQGAISFLLLPVYLHYLTPYDFGILALLDIINMLFGSIILQGIPTALFRSYSYDYVGQDIEQKEAVGTAFIYILISSFVFFGVLGLCAPYITHVVFKDSNPVSLVRLIFLTGFLYSVTNIPFVVMRAKLQSRLMITISILRGLSTIILNVFFVAYMKMNVEGIVWGNLIPTAVMFFITPLLLKNDILWRLSFSKLKTMLSFGWPLVPSFIASWILSSTDRYFIEHLSTTSELGLYSLGFKIASIMTLVFLQPFQIAWPAVFFPKANDSDAISIFQRFTTYFMLLGCGFGLGLILGAEPLIKIMGTKEYWSAYMVVPLVVFSLMLGVGGFQEILNAGLYLKNKTKYIAVITILGAVINVAFNVVLIPHFGMMGAATATMISSFMMVVFTYIASSKFYKIKFQTFRLLHVLIVIIALMIVNLLTHTTSLIAMIFIKTLLLMSYPVLLYSTGFFTKDEKIWLGKIIHRVFNLCKPDISL
ncbi:MAG TPA: oligosaccharide flippase family protein [Bacteroidales bacterium]|nr:oligosaccharide flippase family protein [Bacteroidales bacterium]